MIDKLKEKILFIRLQRKNKDAFAEFYNRYIDKVYQYIFFKVNSKEDAEDLTSAFFLKFWEFINEGKITNHKTVKPFIYTVARNIVIDHYRKTNQHKTISIDATFDEEEEKTKDYIDPKQNVKEQVANNFEIEIIKSKLFELKDEYREVIVLRYIEELSVKEIAEVLNKTKGNVNVLSHRALKALREIVEKNA